VPEISLVANALESIFAAGSERSATAERAESYDNVRAKAMRRRPERRSLLDALRSANGTAIIAEIKRASPSAGLLTHNFDPVAIARSYTAAGADAISVLTEPDYFLGDLAFLDAVRDVTHLPLLRKDFIARRYDVAQSAAYGADGVLLIVAVLDDVALRACLDEAAAYALDALVEVHDEEELNRAVAAGARFVGVNNRDLRTLTTDRALSELLLPSVPAGIFAISESGIHDAEDLRRIRRAGASGFLIGESLMRSQSRRELIASFKAALEAEPTP
jgi:indole-3-glycerol phosphate synthase